MFTTGFIGGGGCKFFTWFILTLHSVFYSTASQPQTYSYYPSGNNCEFSLNIKTHQTF